MADNALLGRLRQSIVPAMPATHSAHPLPHALQHAIVAQRSFRNTHKQTYFCPKLIRDGVVTWGGFLADDSSQCCSNLETHLQCLHPPTVEGDTGCLELELWNSWSKLTVGVRMSYPKTLDNRQSMDVWRRFCYSTLCYSTLCYSTPSDLKDFVRKALWKNFPVGARLAKWQPTAIYCPLDGEIETIEHITISCRFLPSVSE
jgi:hypothetical protein